MRNLVFLLFLALVASGAPAQFTPGNVVVADENGYLYEVTPAGGVSRLWKIRPPIWGLDFDARGDLLAAGAGSLWRVNPLGKVTTLFDGLHTYNIGDVEVNAAGNAYITAMGNNFLVEVDPGGAVVNVFPLTGATRAWGMGIDPRSGLIYVTALNAVYTVDPAKKTVKQIHVGKISSFYQGGTFGPTGRFAFTDELGGKFHEIDATGKVTTVFQGLPLVDPGEGVTLDPGGDYLFTDDGAVVGPTQNRVFRIRPGSPAVLSTLTASPAFSDVNGLVSVPGLFLVNLSPRIRIGSTGLLGVNAVDGALEPYAFATALSARTGISLPGGRRFPLDPDDLFLATARNLLPTLFQNYRGVLDLAGNAVLKMGVPGIKALVGLEVYTAGLTLNPRSPGNIHLVSSAVKTEIIQ